MNLTRLLCLSIMLCCLAAPASAQWGLIRAPQIEDVFLRNDGDDASAGGLDLGGGLTTAGPVVSGSHIQLATSGRLIHPGLTSRWFGPFSVGNATVVASSTSVYAIPLAANDVLFVPLDIPFIQYGAGLILDKVTVVGSTATSSAYITEVAIVTQAPSTGLLTVQVNNTNDVGSGSTGSFFHNAFSGEYSLPNFPLLLRVTTAGMTLPQDVSLHAVIVEYHRE